MKQFSCPHTNFYGWETFKDDKVTSLLTRENILTDMRDYVSQHMSLIFTGFQENVLMRTSPSTTQGASTLNVGKFFYSALEDDDDDDMDITTKSHIINANPTTDNLHVTLKAVNMLDFIQTYFVDTNEEPIFVQIYGPVNNRIEVHYEAINHIQFQEVQEIQIETLNIFMTDSDKNVGLSPAMPGDVQQPGNIMYSNGNHQRQAFRYHIRTSDSVAPSKAKRTKPSFRKSNQSNDTYHSASIAGHIKVDIQATLSVVTPNQQQAPNTESFQGTHASIATASM
jgi:hypothetical protein